MRGNFTRGISKFLENFAEFEMLQEFWNSTPNIQISMIN